MRRQKEWPRRGFLQATLGAGALTVLDMFVPAWARNMRVGGGDGGPEKYPRVFDLAIREHKIDIAGGQGSGMSVNNTIPGPLLEWQEGREVVLRVTNHLHHDTSIHWHGILLPFEMDGVPGVTFRGIEPGATFEYRFPVKQSGTYWYHSHSELQEQSGVYGPLVIHPKDGDPAPCDRDYVVMLSDWTFEDPHQVLSRLRKMSDYYNYQQFTLHDRYDAEPAMTAREAWRTKLAWDRMRMMPTDIADVTAATYTYLMNGLHPAGNWTGLFQPGERVRLRVINGSSMTYFNVRIPGLAMTVVAADGQDIRPVEVDEFQIGTAEVYDVVVQPAADRAYTIMAESMDRSGYAAGTLATRPGQRAAVPALRKRPLLGMADMGMMSMSHTGPDGTSHGPAVQGAMDHEMHHVEPDDPHGRQHLPAGAATFVPGPVVARHGSDQHGPGNVAVAELERDRLGEPGTGLEQVSHRVLVYTDLQRSANDFDTRQPGREIELHLTGHMERYMWSFDGKQFHEVDGPIEFEYGERLRLILVNDTMMNHPIHLHGMWMELENGRDGSLPRKHTINVKPSARVSALITADAPGRWAFHCHLLYHMEMGMFRVVRVS